MTLLAVLDDHGQRVVREARLDRVVELDIGQFGAADDAFLRLGRQRVPAGQVVQVLLHDHIAAAGKAAILVADQHGIDRRLALRVFGAVDKAQQIAVVEIAKAVHLVGDRHRVAEPRHDLGRQLEAQIHALGADVEQHVARRGDGVARSGAEFPERMQLGRARLAEQPVPNRPIRTPMTQDSLPSRSRNPTARSSAARSAHSERTAASAPGRG